MAIGKDTYKYLALALIAVLAASYLGYITIDQNGLSIGDTTEPDTTEPTIPDDTYIPEVPSGIIRTGNAIWHIKTITTQTATVAADTAYVGICVADSNGYFNPLLFSEKTEKDADGSDTSSEFYSAGDELLIFVSSDDDASGCNETYSRAFYIESLDHNAPVLALPESNPINALTEYESGNNFRYTVTASICETTGQTVQWYEGGDGSYWQFGTFKIWERLADENTIVQHISAGVVGATFNDGASWENTDGEINANYTFTGNTQDIYLQLIGEDDNGAWGVPTLAVTSAGQIKQYQGVIIFATDAIGISTQPILDDGWEYMAVPGLTDDIAFYYPIYDIPALGGTLDVSVPVTIDDSMLTASTEYEFEVYFLDWQCIEDVARGSTSASVPTGNGVVEEVGADAVSQPLALTVSSNAVSTAQLLGHWTTNA